MPEAFCGLEMCAKKLRELCALCERKASANCSQTFFFSQKDTDEQNTQHFTEPLRAAELTERYSQQRPHPQPLSEWRGE